MWDFYEPIPLTPEAVGVIIRVDDCCFPVTPNLYWALRVLRSDSQGEGRPLWIDAVCINQHDKNERNHQVAQMSQIYRAAARVVVWLGRESASTLLVFQFAERLAAAETLEEALGLQPDQLELLDPEVRHVYEWHLGGVRAGVNISLMDHWNSLSQLCERHYFTRLWIVQEIVLASDIVIYWGWVRLRWDISEAMAKVETGPRSINPHALGRIAASRAFQLWRQKQMWERGGDTENDALFLMLSHRESGCTNVRDRVFGMLGLTMQCCRAANPVDDSQSCSTICRNLLHHYFERHWVSYDSHNTFKTSRLVHDALLVAYEGCFQSSALESPPQRFSAEVKRPDLYIYASGFTKTKILWLSTLLDTPKSEDQASAPRAKKIILRELGKILKAKGNTFPNLRIADRTSQPKRLVLYGVTRGLDSNHIYAEEEQNFLVKGPFEAEEPEGLENLKEVFQSVIEYSNRVISARSTSHARSKVFMDFEGNFGLAPEESLAGDFLVSFIDSHICLIVRYASGQYKVIGQAACFARGASDSNFSANSELALKTGVLKFSMDMDMLQQLTCFQN
jgi:hypothetical protein